VHPTGGSLRVFKPFVWLQAGSVKVALSHPAHQRVTQAVGRLIAKKMTLYSIREVDDATRILFRRRQ